ncbi:MAG TPA: type III-B CRISPR module RAMP protein Cmr6 [Chloroflexia bacterium]|nr:type III-B CRISPR module RAMP protein Cmr6 [Chloroflexia bacterium]
MSRQRVAARRDALERLPARRDMHAGLWLDRYLAFQQRDADSRPAIEEPARDEPRAQLVREVAAMDEPPAYTGFYQRWRAALPATAQVGEAQARGRLAIGLGAESVLETAIALHRTYGVPYLPGSALKGLAAAYARQRLGAEWAAESPAYQTVFGTTTAAGYVTFFDALYLPGSGHDRRALHVDVITVHHPDYYQQGRTAPADWDSPTPVPFLSATGRYLVALAAVPGAEAWVARTFAILALALAELGIGAKTASGYGRMELTMEK